MICLLVVFTLPLSYRTCIKWLILWYTYGFEGRMAVVLCGVLINGVGRVVSLDYRKLGM